MVGWACGLHPVRSKSWEDKARGKAKPQPPVRSGGMMLGDNHSQWEQGGSPCSIFLCRRFFVQAFANPRPTSSRYSEERGKPLERDQPIPVEHGTEHENQC